MASSCAQRTTHVHHSPRACISLSTPSPPPQQPDRGLHRGLRRSLLLGGVATAGILTAPRVSLAALAQFPASQLHNAYWLVRAGESEAEAAGTVLTNPAWKQSGGASLSRPRGTTAAAAAAGALRDAGVCGDAGCWIWPSVTASAYQTAEILALALGIGRSRIVPEYSFLDARGVGALDGLPLSDVASALQSGDAADAGWRPPPGYDGTPHESAQDVLARVRQLMSVTETQYSGEDVVLVAPDSDTLSVLQAAVLGLDLRAHRSLAFAPGEVRRLRLSQQSYDASPMTLPCPRPPACN